MPHPSWPAWLDRPGEAALPSGLHVVVGARDETWVTVELGERRCVTVDDLAPEEPDGVLLGLHRPGPWPPREPGVRPYGDEATVRLAPETGALTVVALPTGPHEDADAPCDCRVAAAFRAWCSPDRIVGLLETLARLPVDDAAWDVRQVPPLVWRGRTDADGRALVEELPRDDVRWPEEDLPVAAVVPLPPIPA